MAEEKSKITEIDESVESQTKISDIMKSTPPKNVNVQKPINNATRSIGEIDKPYLLISIFVYPGNFAPEVVNCLLIIQKELFKNGWRYEVIFTTNKNEAVAVFMQNKLFTHILFVGSNIIWNYRDLQKLIEDNLDFICVAIPSPNYQFETLFTENMIENLSKVSKEQIKFIDQFKDNIQDKQAQSQIQNLFASNILNLKSKLLRYQIEFEPNAKITIEKGGVLQVKLALALDFALIKKKPFEKMINEYSYLKMEDQTIQPKFGEFYYNLFGYEPNKKLSADAVFCRRYNEIGGKVMIDATVPISTCNNSSIIQSHLFPSLVQFIQPQDNKQNEKSNTPKATAGDSSSTIITTIDNNTTTTTSRSRKSNVGMEKLD